MGVSWLHWTIPWGVVDTERESIYTPYWKVYVSVYTYDIYLYTIYMYIHIHAKVYIHNVYTYYVYMYAYIHIYTYKHIRTRSII